VERFGRPVETGVPGLTRLFPDAAVLAAADLAGVGLTQRRAATLRELARAVHAGELALGPSADPGEAMAALRLLPGIGEWTAQYVALRALGEPDAFPASDLWLRRAAGCTSERALLARAEAWRPWRSYAALQLWESLTAAPAGAR
jgi:AraC family transcriptional regulator of adaptative response / DNA-3-methyladenine glycosylase II